MPQLPLLSGVEIISILSHFGYRIQRQRGSHIRLSCLGRNSITVPDYDEIDRSLLRKILRDAQIGSEEFLHFMKKK